MQKNNSYDAIVIGAGISGLLTALALSKESKKVLIIEKSDVLGGNCRTYKIDGYSMDTGPHAITGLDDGPLQILMDRYFNRQPEFSPIGSYYARDGKKFQKIPFTIPQLARFSILSEADRINFLRILMHGIASSSIQSKKNELEKNVYDYIKDFGFSPKGLRYMDTLAIFLSGRPMKETPAWRMLGGHGSLNEKEGQYIQGRRYSEKVKKIFLNDFRTHGYPIGGIQKITDAVIGSIPEGAAEFHKNEEVVKITVSQKNIFAIITDKGQYESELVVYSGFVKNLPQIIDGLEYPYCQNLKKIRQTRTMSLWLGLKEKMPEFSYIGSEIYFNTNTPYWAIPVSNYDPALAPKNKQLVGFSTVIKEEDDQKQLQKLRNTIYKAIPGIKSKIELEHLQITIPEKAAITINAKFPSPKSPIHGLYLVGTDTDIRSMGVTRAAYSVLEALKFMRKDGFLE